MDLDDLIHRSKVLEVVFNIMSDSKVVHKHQALNRNIKQIPKADTERHAHWIDNGIDYRGANWYKCSNCGRTVCEHYSMVVDEEYPYCHCGCKMDKV